VPKALATNRNRSLALTACCFAAAMAGHQAAWSQSEVYCTVTKVQAESLTNAVRLTISADGMLQFRIDPLDYFTQEGGDWVHRHVSTITFRLPNARTSLGSFVDVASYPVSHVQFAIPPESREGVGLDVSIALYGAAVVQRVEVGNQYQFGSMYGFVEPPAFQITASSDGRSLIIIVQSDRYREAGVTREAAVPGRSALAVTPEGDGLISVHALNTPLGEVLRAISETDGVDIVVRGGANYRASMTISRAPPAAILRAIARGYGLSLRTVEGVYYITEGLPGEVDAYWASATATFPLHHIPPALALDLLPDFLLRYVHVNAEQNALVAAGPPQLLDKLDSDLRAIDRPLPQVEVSAMLVEERRSGGLALATEILLGPGLHQLGAIGLTGQLGYRLAEDSIHDLRVKLQALTDREVIRTRVCPSVTVACGSQADLFLGRRQFFGFLSDSGMGPEVILSSTDVGSHIVAQPWTGDGRSITIPLRVQANTVLSVDEHGLPLVATREVRGTLRVLSGDTIILSGLTMNTVDTKRSRSPVPLVGELSRTHHKLTESSEALVLLTARAYTDVHEARTKTEPS